MSGDSGWFARLDAATDYVALASALLGFELKSRTGDEAYGVCPLHDDCKDPSKFSFNTKNGMWSCHRTGEGNSMLRTIKEKYPDDWRDRWVTACPSAADAFNEKKTEKLSSQNQRAEAAPAPSPSSSDEALTPLSAAWRIPLDTLRAQGWGMVRKGQFCVPIYDPETGKECGRRVRYIPPHPKIGKTRLEKGSTRGLYGLGALERVGTDGKPLPVLICEGEKDWAVADADYSGRFAVISPSHGVNQRLDAVGPRLAGREVIFAYDSDAAGNEAVLKAAHAIASFAKTVRIARWPEADKDTFNYLRDEGRADAFLKAIEEAKPYTAESRVLDVPTAIREFISDVDKIDVVSFAEHIVRVLRDAGAFIFRDTDFGYIHFNGMLYQIGNNPSWNTCFAAWTGLDIGSSIGRRTAALVDDIVRVTGDLVDPNRWSIAKGNSLYVALGVNAPLLEISPKTGLREVPSGTNGAYIFPGDMMVHPPHLMLDDAFDAKRAQSEWDWYMSRFTCDDRQLALLDALHVVIFAHSLIRTRPIIRFEGGPGSGKTSAASLMSLLLYGDTTLYRFTPAAIYRTASRVPVLFLDNIEEGNLTDDLVDIMLLSVGDIARIKSKRESDSQTVREVMRSWVLTTGIDPITGAKQELVERLLVVNFGSRRIDAYDQMGAEARVLENRDLLLNFIWRRVLKLLCDIEKGAMTRAMSTLPTSMRSRLREAYALCTIVRGYEGADDEILMELLDEHKEMEDDASVEDSPIVDMLCVLPGFSTTPQGQVLLGSARAVTGGWEIRCTVEKLLSALSAAARYTGKSWPYSGGRAFATRFGLLKEKLEDVGFRIERRKETVNNRRGWLWVIFIPSHRGKTVVDQQEIEFLPDQMPE